MEQKKKGGMRNFDRCAYRGCKNGRFTTKHLLHHFPTENKPGRLEAWLTNCGNEKLLEYSANTLQRHAICGDHFALECFHNNDRTRQLKKGTIPFHYEEVSPIEARGNEINVEMNLSSEKPEIPKELNTTIKTSPTNESVVVPKNSSPVVNLVVTDTWKDRELTKLQNENKILRTELREYRLSLKFTRIKLERTLRERTKRVSKNPATLRKQRRAEIEELLDQMDLHPTAKALIKLQLHTPNSPYTEEEKNVVKKLYFESSEGVKYLRRIGCHIPSENSLRTWLDEDEMPAETCKVIEAQEKVLTR